MWQCPLCQSPLSLMGNSWLCDNRHSFDRAKSGYVNLLPVQKKRSKAPGDNDEMLKARRDFHQTRGYLPLMESLRDSVRSYIEGLETEILDVTQKDKQTSPISNDEQSSNAVIIYDAGCGEGAYLGFLAEQLTSHSIQFCGSDIAKKAVEMSAKALPQGQFAVASSFDLPVLKHSIDIALQIFAPGSDTEYHRVIKPHGRLLVVEPGAKHLWELKRAVYNSPQTHVNQQTARNGFNLLNSIKVTNTLRFTSDEQKQGLLGMTPYVWKMNAQQRVDLLAELTEVTTDFVVSEWQPLVVSSANGEQAQ